MKKLALQNTPLLYVGIIFFAGILIARLCYIQIMLGENYATEADRQYIAPRSQAFDRGAIYFTEKDGTHVSAATLKSGYTIAINPSQIVDIDAVYEGLATHLDLDTEEYYERANKLDDPYEELARRVDSNAAENILSLDLPGVIVTKEKWRYYPGDRMLSHALGFVGYKGNALGGRYGLERHYDDILKRDDEKLYVNFFAEVFSNVSELFSTYDTSNREGNIVTTIEPSVQRALERELMLLQEKWNAEAVGGLIMHPGTGAMYAMGSLPDYDPNTFNTVDNASVFTNPIVENVYEMGSIVKPLTVAIGLDTGSIVSTDTYVDHGSVFIDGARISNYDGRARGEVEMQQILNQSLNTGVVHIMQKTGRDDFRKYMKKFGVETRTGIDLPSEVRGLASNLDSEQLVEYATASFGQGIAYTPIAMARALAALGNGGTLVTPHLVREIDYSLGFSESVEYEVGERVISEQTSDEISRMLVEVVDTALRGGKVKMPGYSIAAKTGTAQIPDSEAGGYLEDEFLHSFFGYFPAYDPEFLIFLYVIKPHDVKYASETLTEPFFNLTRFLIHYYDIPPDR